MHLFTAVPYVTLILLNIYYYTNLDTSQLTYLYMEAGTFFIFLMEYLYNFGTASLRERLVESLGFTFGVPAVLVFGDTAILLGFMIYFWYEQYQAGLQGYKYLIFGSSATLIFFQLLTLGAHYVNFFTTIY